MRDKIKYIDIGLLVPTQRVEDTCRIDLQKLALDIASRGFDENYPLKIVEEDGVYYIGNGHHRYLASRWVGLKEVPIIVIPKEHFIYDSVQDMKDYRNYKDEDINEWLEYLGILSEIDYKICNFDIREYIANYKELVNRLCI